MNVAMSWKNYVRSKKYMVVDSAVMANMITAPQHHVITYRRKRLDGIIFQDKAVFTD